MNGELIKETFFILQELPKGTPVELDILTSSTSDCPFCLTVLADEVDESEYKNDKTGFLFKFSELITSLTFTLQKKVDGTFVDVETLNNDNWGTLYPLEFIIDDKNRKYVGYLVDWRLVLSGHGTGFYRLKTIETNLFGTFEQLSSEYCLLAYTSHRANGTVKIETNTSGLSGDINDPTDIISYGSGWYTSIRLCGMFGFDTSDYVEERTEYRNGQQKWIKDEQTVKYTLKLKPINAELHNFLKTNILQADEIIITDYNANNPNKHVSVNVNRNGNYEPQWQPKTLLAKVDVSFKSAFNNLRKKLC